MLSVEYLIQKLAPVIGQEKANVLLYKYNSLQDIKQKKRFEDKVRLLCYKTLGTDFEQKILLSPPPGQKINRNDVLGQIVYNDKALLPFGISNKELLMHTAIIGRSGSGKTNVVFTLIDKLFKKDVPFLIFDWKKNYRSLISKSEYKDVLIFTPGSKTSPFYFNPLIPPPNVEPEIWKEFIIATIGYSYFIGEGAMTILEKGIDRVYQDCGVYDGPVNDFPCFKDVTKAVNAKGMRRGREMLWMQSCSRTLYSLTNSTIAKCINVSRNAMPLEALLKNNVIIELDYLSPSNKVFFTQALLLWIYFYRLAQSRKETLEHMIIIEEAQNLLLIGKEEMKSGNIMPKIIREFRELGIGLCFVAQEVSKMNTTALQNTYSLIALNQRYRKDIDVLGSSMSLKFNEWPYLGKLPIGSAIVNMKGDYPESFLVKFPLVKIKADIDNDELKKHMDERYFNKKTVIMPPIRKRNVFQGISNEANPIPPKVKSKRSVNEEDALLLEIHENPNHSVTQHYKNLGVNYREGNVRKKALIEKGLLKEVSIHDGRVWKKILYLTDEGKNHLENIGLKLEGRKTNAGAEHEYWKDNMKNRLKSTGHKVKEEVTVEYEK